MQQEYTYATIGRFHAQYYGHSVSGAASYEYAFAIGSPIDVHERPLVYLYLVSGPVAHGHKGDSVSEGLKNQRELRSVPRKAPAKPPLHL